MATYNGHQEDSNGNILLPTPHSMAYIEFGTTATRAYSKGELLVFENQLCQTSQVITEGTTLELGTNVLSTTLSNQLSNIRVYVSNSDNKIHFVDHAGADSVLPFNKASGAVAGGEGFEINQLRLSSPVEDGAVYGSDLQFVCKLTDPNAKGVSIARSGNVGSNNPYFKGQNVTKVKAMDGRVYFLVGDPTSEFKFRFCTAPGGINNILSMQVHYEVW